MPMAIPLVIAGFEAYAGVAAIAAAGELTLTAGLSLAGAAFTGIGAITGNKDLMALGAVAGLGAGISSLAGEAAVSSAADSALTGSGNMYAPGADTAAMDAANNAAFAPPAAGSTAGDIVADAGVNTAQNTLAGSKDLIPKTGFAGMSPGTGMQPAIEQAIGGGAPAAAAAAPGPAAAAIQGPAPVGAEAAASGSPSFNTGAAPSNFSTPNADISNPDAGVFKNNPYSKAPSTLDAPGSAGAGTPGDPNSFYEKLKAAGKEFAGYTKDYPELTKGVGGVIQGGMQYYGQQQIAQDNMARQKSYMDWVRQRYSDSVRNLTVPSLQASKSASGGIIAAAKG